MLLVVAIILKVFLYQKAVLSNFLFDVYKSCMPTSTGFALQFISCFMVIHFVSMYRAVSFCIFKASSSLL